MIRLASSSVTRAKLLEDAGIKFIQESVDFDEDSIVTSSPKNFVYLATLGKYEANLKAFGFSDYPLLVADTVVTAKNQILRKAKCVDDARNILMTQSGNITSIITCMIYQSTTKKIIDISQTDYIFDDFDLDDLDRYLDSGEWRGKAGACMVEGFCKPYIKEVRGFESTAMGLNTELLKRFLYPQGASIIYYENELKALKKSGRYRVREVYDDTILDFASNDYLGLSHNKELHNSTCKILSELPVHSSKASLLVNGYHQIHKDFETALCKANGFEDGVILGSGFNANIALVESLVRKGDTLFMDEKYHASGVLASNLNGMHVEFFAHNDMDELKSLLEQSDAKRKIVAVEGIYSMDGDLLKREVFDICDKYDALLIVDEAHSSGVVGDKLMGVFDHYNMPIKPNYIKMGTLGKAYGSFGAFILASEHIVEYLINRAKPIIYATSLSLYDTLLAHNALLYMLNNAEKIKSEIKLRQKIVYKELGVKVDGLIVPILVDDNEKVIEIRDELKALGFAVGAIRQPTVEKAIIRLIARLGCSPEELRELCINLAKINR